MAAEMAIKGTNEMKKGLLMIFTGDGKGKTTSALGLSMRSAGHGLKVCFIQFIKGSWKYGEMDATARFDGLIDFHVMGRGFTWKSDNLEEDKAAARKAWEFSKNAINSGKYHLVVLDEFTYLLNYGMVEMDTVLSVLADRPSGINVAITGRDAPKPLTAAADLVSEIRALKHPYQAGITAQKGIEF
ncbi:MAG: cob(I)yrinic acid a,c-diamide adenosyltransferase [Desulfobacteraceae bacterium]|jgi:cob(I)alamin adenosyltransferase|nr:cob(I)yrinic acid a,c-diamide adenosyltransferase [Desulfobacteraceae bacterium]